MDNLDNKNIFNNDLELLSESADSLFGDINLKPVKENKKNDKIITKKKGKKIDNNSNKNLKSNKKDKKHNKKTLNENKIEENNLNSKKNEQNLNLNNADNAEKENTSKKPKKVKKQLSKTAKLLIIIFVCLAVIGGAVTGLCLYFKSINKKLVTPTYQVIQRQTGTIISIDKIENATAYEIEIDSGSNQFKFTSTSNVIELKSYFNQPGTFTVKVRALGKTQKATSDFAIEQVLKNYVKLETPNVFRAGNIISWNPVENAKEYRVYYKANLNTGAIEYKVVEQNDLLIEFDLEQLNSFGAGLYPVCVEAIADSESYYLNSETSSTIDYVYTQVLAKPLSVTYHKLTKTLSFSVLKGNNNASHFKVAFTFTSDYSTKEFTLVASELECQENASGIITYTANFADFIENEVLNGSIFAVSDNIYQTNSEKVNVSMM